MNSSWLLSRTNQIRWLRISIFIWLAPFHIYHLSFVFTIPTSTTLKHIHINSQHLWHQFLTLLYIFTWTWSMHMFSIDARRPKRLILHFAIEDMPVNFSFGKLQKWKMKWALFWVSSWSADHVLGPLRRNMQWAFLFIWWTSEASSLRCPRDPRSAHFKHFSSYHNIAWPKTKRHYSSSSFQHSQYQEGFFFIEKWMI